MFLKILCLTISILIGTLSIVELNRIPNNKYSLCGNYWRIVFFSSVGCFYDFIMFIVLWFFAIPPGEYGTGIEVMAIIAVLIIYAPACIITSIRLKRRMKHLTDSKYNVNRINSLNCSIFFKVIFIFIVSIWINEVN